MRDHLDRDRSLFGLAALILVPLYTFKAAELNANTVMMPFWAAALLFYLRARRGLDVWDSLSPAPLRALPCSANTGRFICSPAWRRPRWLEQARGDFGDRRRPM